MISRIEITNVATYKSGVNIAPKKINFIYGGNGTGKTTLSRVLAQDIPGEYEITWKSDQPLKTFVFNREFVERNLSQRISGIFTLGEDNTEAVESLEALRERENELKRDIQTKQSAIQERTEGIEGLRNQFTESCWVQKKTFEQFRESLRGKISSKKAFAEECLAALQKESLGESANIDSLSTRYDALYNMRLERYDLLAELPFPDMSSVDGFDLLEIPIVGSADAPIGAFIDYLNNSNWVKEGLQYLEKSEGKCPFCQSHLTRETSADLAAYFDERYEQEFDSLQYFASWHENTTRQLLQNCKESLEAVPQSIDSNPLKEAVASLEKRAAQSQLTIASKLADPSKVVTTSSITIDTQDVSARIIEINSAIMEHNTLVDNINTERAKFTTCIWDSIARNLDPLYKKTQKEINGRKRAVENLKEQISELEAKVDNIRIEIDRIEATRTSISPTVKAINDLLQRFGFEGFSIAEDKDNEGFYKIIRPTGEDAKATLSEGEYNFVSFLYFYHLVYGSDNKTGIAEPRVVVIDDPISSLDSNVMFVVTTLAKEILRDCRDEKHGIRQAFILTHNVYFHKEITFLGSRSTWPTTQCAYWVINKCNETSEIETTDTNPVSTAYELLWGEVRDAGATPNKNIFNTMRRILEYYFNVVGGMDYEVVVNGFDGPDKTVCKSLISCINEQSHLVNDDFVMCFSAESIASYARVFKRIFELTGHEAHYNMMLGQSGSVPIQA